MSLFAELTSGVNAVRPGRTALPAFDRPLLAATLMLTLFGLLMVYSASIALADGPRYESYGRYYFVIRHALFIVVGVVLAMFTATVPLRVWQKLAVPLFALAILLVAGGPGSRHWAGSERGATLVALGPYQLSAFGADEAGYGAVCRGLHRA